MSCCSLGLHLAPLEQQDDGSFQLAEVAQERQVLRQPLAVAQRQVPTTEALALVLVQQQLVLSWQPGSGVPRPAPLHSRSKQKTIVRPVLAEESHLRWTHRLMRLVLVMSGSLSEVVPDLSRVPRFWAPELAFLSHHAEFHRYTAPVPGPQPNLQQLLEPRPQSFAQALDQAHQPIPENLFQH
jgi:hypothetical protein|tara:strand:- start:1969 stop:2517 length:549 start_codon:yes stop_codon:yes gene_type:complete